MGGHVGIGEQIVHLLRIHPRLGRLSRKEQAAEIGVHQSVLTRWEQGVEPKRDKANRAAAVLGLGPNDLGRPTEQLERMVASGSGADWERSDWTITGRTVERWRYLWQKTFEILRGSHLLYLRIPKDSGDDLLSVSLVTVDELDAASGLRFSIVNVDDSQQEPGLEIVYRYDGVAVPVADTIHFTGGSEDGTEPLSMVLDRPQQRGALSGYLVAVGRAPGEHRPMARRVVLRPLGLEAVGLPEVRERLGIFPWSEAPPGARLLGAPDR